MRVTAGLPLFLASSVVAGSGFAACSAGPGPSAPPPSDTASGAAPAPAQATARPSPDATFAPGDAGPADASASKPAGVADCKERLAEITNDVPDGGVVMSNAMTAADAGASDRLQPLIDLVKSKREAFRCCFDPWARHNPGQKGHVVMTFEIDPGGALKRAAVKESETDVKSPEVAACMVDLAKSMTYPRSPSNKETLFTYRFELRAR